MLESSGSASLCFHKASLLLVIFLNSLFSYQGSCVALASDSYNIAVLFPFVNNFFKEISFFHCKWFGNCILDKTSSFPVPISIFLPFFLLFCHLYLIVSLFLDIWNCLISHISKITMQSRQTWNRPAHLDISFRIRFFYFVFDCFSNTVLSNLKLADMQSLSVSSFLGSSDFFSSPQPSSFCFLMLSASFLGCDDSFTAPQPSLSDFWMLPILFYLL